MAQARKPWLFALPVDWGEFWLYFIPAVVFLIPTVVYLRNIRILTSAGRIGRRSSAPGLYEWKASM